MNTRAAMRRTLVLALATTAFIPVAAQAQSQDGETAPGRTSTLDSFNDIIVTGTKTQNPENVQDVPLAVTAFGEQTLEAFKIRDISGLSFQIPNVSLDQVGTTRGVANFTIRGVGINSSIPSVDPTVGVFVDGVFLGVNGGVVFDLFDLASVEVLRGPQGVLFGRNVTGGAVVINTGNPTEDFRGKFRAAVDGPVDSGRGGPNYTFSGVVSGPLIEDTLLFKVGAYYNKDEGYFLNRFNNTNHGQAETKILRGALEARLGDLNLLAKLDYFDSEGDGPSSQNRGLFDRRSFVISIDEPGFYRSEIWTGSLQANLDVGPGTLTNIFGYRKLDGRTRGDIDGTPQFLFHSNSATDQEQFSNELRYAMSGLRYDLVFGAFYFEQTLAYDESRELRRDLPPALRPPQFFGGGRQDHEVLGLFANLNYEILDGLKVLAGIRWNRETKDAGVTFLTARPPCSFLNNTCPTGTAPFVPGVERDGFTDSVEFENLSPKLGLQYEFADSQVYGHWSRGFRSGGYNFRITDVAVFNRAFLQTGLLGFDEEQVDSFEVGGKFQTADGSLTLNVAGYVTKIGNMQREVNLSDPGAGIVQNILNTADATIKGFEAEARMRVSPSLVFTANIGIIDADYDEILFDLSGDGFVNERDFALEIPRVVPYTFGAGLIHELNVGRSQFLTRVNYQYRDKAAYTDDNFGWLNDLSMLEANLTWVTPLQGLSLSVYGRNLFDQVQEGGDTQVPFRGPLSLPPGQARTFSPNPPNGTFTPLMRGRNIGVELLFEF